MSKVFEIKDSSPFTVESDNEHTVTLLIDTKSPDIFYNIRHADMKILVYIRYGQDVNLKESGFIEDSKVMIQYIELSDHSFRQNTQIKVKEGSSLEVNTIYLGIHEKKIDFNLINSQSDTEVLIRNNVVCLNNADIVLNVIGTIEKGAKRSKCHQKNHCLTIGNPKKAEVLPVLKIDENDVEASHSLSSGTIDEEVLFYMNSRGLSRKEALNLMVLSYLLPKKEKFMEFEKGEELYELSLRKVKEVCLM